MKTGVLCVLCVLLLLLLLFVWDLHTSFSSLEGLWALLPLELAPRDAQDVESPVHVSIPYPSAHFACEKAMADRERGTLP